ncbi:MAG: AAA family ATPase [Deltaproteobacteria bacterium]|nr:AAA family ATPase [Deltaproteobacteria bacterium]
MRIMVGNIGSGKSLIASKFAQRGDVVYNNDAVTRMIGGGQYGLYDTQKKEIYRVAEETTIITALSNNFHVVIDRTNMDRKRRERFIEIGKKYAKDIIAYDFGEGTNKGRDRRIKNGYGVPASVWQEVFEFMKQSYEEPALNEGFTEIIEMPQKYKFHAFDFDGTIVENKFPDIGEILDGTVNRLNKLFDELSNIIIIWSCRSGDYEAQMRKCLLDNRIPFDFINENPMVDYGGRKIFAHEYYDDRNVSCQ